MERRFDLDFICVGDTALAADITGIRHTCMSLGNRSKIVSKPKIHYFIFLKIIQFKYQLINFIIIMSQTYRYVYIFIYVYIYGVQLILKSFFSRIGYAGNEIMVLVPKCKKKIKYHVLILWFSMFSTPWPKLLRKKLLGPTWFYRTK